MSTAGSPVTWADLSSASAGMLAAPVLATGTDAAAGTIAAPQQAVGTDAVAANAGAGTTIQQDQTLGTVEGRTDSIIAADSPLMQRAAAKANETANSRGLINSSMAVGSAQNAVLDAAAPMAAADAASYNDIAKGNQDATNSFLQYNANNEQQVNVMNADTANTMSQANAQAANAMATQQAANELQTSLANADTANKTSQINAQAANDIATQQAANELQASLANTQYQNQLVFDQLDQANKVQLASIEAAYKNEMQANVTASSLFSDTMNALSIIQKDTTMNAETKQRNIDQMVQMLDAGLNMAGTIANLNLGGALDFGTAA